MHISCLSWVSPEASAKIRVVSGEISIAVLFKNSPRERLCVGVADHSGMKSQVYTVNELLMGQTSHWCNIALLINP